MGFVFINTERIYVEHPGFYYTIAFRAVFMCIIILTLNNQMSDVIPIDDGI